MTSVDPIFNEPSFAPPAGDLTEARARMAGAIAVLNLVPDRGLGKGLRISDEFYTLELAPHYTIISWIDDQEIDRVQRGFFLELAAKAPFLRFDDGTPFERLEDSEVSCQEQTHPAFLAAYALDAPLVSFDHDVWTEPDLPAVTTCLDGEGELVEEATKLINFARPEHLDYHASWFDERNAVASTKDLWTRRAELFPNLVFCECVEPQLPSQEPILRLILERLTDLQRVAALGQPFNKDAFSSQCKPTSQSTFESYGQHYNFTAPNGATRCCGWHLNLPDGKRVYFDTDFYVGHIGKHLPTKKYH